jgi:tryptophanyl-tRNA synthetase
VIYLLDRPDLVRRKVSRAVTDSGTAVRYEPRRAPAVANLLEILAACERTEPAVVSERYGSYAELEEALTEAIVQTLAPVQRRYAELVADRSMIDDIRQQGAQAARDRAGRTVSRAKRAIGLTP